MRVLFVQGAGERAGAEVALLARLRHLPDHGIEPVVAFLAAGPFVDEVRAAGVRVVPVAAAPPRVRELWRLPRAVRALAAVVREVDADVVEGVGEKMALLAGWAARLARRPCVFSLHDAPRRDPASTLVQLAALTGRRDATVVPSAWMARAFRRAWGMRSDIVPNAIVAVALPPPADLRREAGWAPDALVVGLFGRLVRWKGQEVFVRAAARLSESLPAARFVVVGGSLYGWERDYAGGLRELAERVGVADRIWFTGHRRDALGLMAACDVVCHCSLEPEPFGVVVTEGMALGRPVVATRTGGPEEIVADGRTGVLVAPGDAAALAAALCELATDPARRARLGTLAAAAVQRRYDSRRVAQTSAALYRRVAAPAAA